MFAGMVKAEMSTTFKKPLFCLVISLSSFLINYNLILKKKASKYKFIAKRSLIQFTKILELQIRKGGWKVGEMI